MTSAPAQPQARSTWYRIARGDGITTTELWLVGAVIAAGAAFRLYVLRDGNFWLDDLNLLARDPASLDDWLRPHAGHWNTVPMAAYRGLFALFGMDYHPGYQLFRVIGHGLFALATWRIMRWRGTDRWVALVATAVLVVLSSTVEYKVIAIGIWLAALAVVTSAIVIERCPTPQRSQQLVVFVALLVASMSTGIGAIGTGVILGMVVLYRRWRWTPPLLAVLGIYGVWYLRYGDQIAATEDTSLLDRSVLARLPGNLVELAHLTLSHVTLPDTDIGVALLVVITLALVFRAIRGELGFAAVTMLAVVGAYYVGLHVNRIEPGLIPIDAPRYANTPYFLLAPTLLHLIPRPRSATVVGAILAVGVGLVGAQLVEFSDVADPLVARQDSQWVSLVVTRELIQAGEPVLEGHEEGRPGVVPAPRLRDAPGWPEIADPSATQLEEARGRLRIVRHLDLAPIVELPEEVLRTDYGHLLVDGDPLIDACVEAPGDHELTYRGTTAFRVRIAVEELSDPASVTVKTSDSFGEGRRRINVANFAVVVVLAPDGEEAGLTLASDQTVSAVCPHLIGAGNTEPD